MQKEKNQEKGESQKEKECVIRSRQSEIAIEQETERPRGIRWVQEDSGQENLRALKYGINSRGAVLHSDRHWGRRGGQLLETVPLMAQPMMRGETNCKLAASLSTSTIKHVACNIMLGIDGNIQL
jgi:hypothetical protein